MNLGNLLSGAAQMAAASLDIPGVTQPPPPPPAARRAVQAQRASSGEGYAVGGGLTLMGIIATYAALRYFRVIPKII